MKTKYRIQTDVLLFILITFIAHRLYWMNIQYLDDTDLIISIRGFLKNTVFNQSSFVLKLLTNQFEYSNTTIYLTNLKYVEINESCTGFKQFYQVIVLFMLFPGPFKHKCWFIPLGIIIMHFINIFRIVILAFLLRYDQNIWQFSHDWILRPFFYVVIFSLWWIWNEGIRSIKTNTNQFCKSI